MTIKETRSYRRKISLLYLVKEGEMSIASALDRTEDLYDEGKLVETDYNFLADLFENQLMKDMETNSEENTEEEEE